MTERSTRRRYLRVLGVGSIASLAGCTGSGDADDETPATDAPEEGTETPDTEETDEEGTDGNASSPGALDGAPMFRYDAANTGHAPDESGPAESPAVAWTVDLGDKVSSAAVVDGTVHVGSLDGTVHALTEP
ncbi:hypothetical protein BRC81_06305 [Halobacteriales archaeon QS_1_68_20]|nr:MAG: hypothetical protein BRC81_06305 [Halobacteriales archaeon QS_1_68_20]